MSLVYQVAELDLRYLIRGRVKIYYYNFNNKTRFLRDKAKIWPKGGEEVSIGR